MTMKQTIAERAYQLWNARGRPHGSEQEDWLEAERQLASEEVDPSSCAADGALDATLQETFPASDPPASHIADEPPSNAQDKWDAATRSPNAMA